MNDVAAQIEAAPAHSNLGGYKPYAAALRAISSGKAEAVLGAMGAEWNRARFYFGCEVMLDATDSAEIALSEHEEVSRLMTEAGFAYSMDLVLASFVAEYGEQD